MENKNIIVYSLSANKKLARSLAKSLPAQLGKVSLTHFADGELLVKTFSNVYEKTAIVIQSTCKPAHEKLFEILLLLDSIKRSNAKKTILVMPYFGYSRQERVSWINEPVSCQVVARMLNTTKVDLLLTFDLHHPLIESFFEVPIIDIPTTSLFANYYLKFFKERNINLEDVIVVSPDHGSNKRASMLKSSLIGTNMIILDKIRPMPNVAEHLEINDDVTNKFCILIDDIVDTGGTLVSASNLLYKHGAKEVYVAASHAVFSKKCINKLKAAKIKDIVVTNTIEKKLPNDIKVLDIMPLIKEHIKQ